MGSKHWIICGPAAQNSTCAIVVCIITLNQCFLTNVKKSFPRIILSFQSSTPELFSTIDKPVLFRHFMMVEDDIFIYSFSQVTLTFVYPNKCWPLNPSLSPQ